jgi:hypothetical protein
MDKIRCKYCGNERAPGTAPHSCPYAAFMDWLETEIGRVR